jgi:hypothetical protein
MYQSEKSFLEKVANAIPGLKGYRDKEARRDTDKRLREYMAAEIDRQRKALDALKRDLMGKGKLDLLDEADRVVRKMQKSADALRFASYGYAGFFDQVKLREEEIDRLYQHDSGILEQVRALEAQVEAAGSAADPAQALADLEAAVDALNAGIEGRKQVFQVPG